MLARFNSTRLSALVLGAFAILVSASPVLATSLDKVMNGQVENLEVKVRGTGSYTGDCIEVSFANVTGRTKTVTVPLGLLLVPKDSNTQTMVCAGKETLKAPPGNSRHLIKAFCGEENDAAPGTDDIFRSGGIAPRDLLKVILKLRRSDQFDSSGQGRLWKTSGNIDISQGNSGYTDGSRDTAASIAGLILLLTWMLMNRMSNVPIDPAALAPAGNAPSAPDEDTRQSGDHSDRPSWSLMHRQNYDDLYDEDKERYVARDSAAGKGIVEKQRQEMKDKGFNYDEYSDSYVQEGMEYDRYEDRYRRESELGPAPEEFNIEKETSDSTKPYIGAGWLIRGDPGTGSDYETVYKNLNDRLTYLESLEKDTREAHKNANEQENRAKQDGDQWLEEKWRERRKNTIKNMRQIQQAKNDLTRRVDERSEREKAHWDNQKKKWTADKVGSELKDIFIPNPKHLEPLFRRTLELRNRLQESINRQDGLFRNVDDTIAEIKSATHRAREARAAGDLKAARELMKRADTGRARLNRLNEQMQDIHKRKGQWQIGSQVLTATAGMTATQYVGQARMLHEIGKSASQFLKPRMGVHRPSMLDEDGDIIGTDKTRSGPKRGKNVADGSAASPEDLSRRDNYDFYAVDKDGNVRELKLTGNVDAKPHPNEGIFIRDKHTGKVSPHKFYGEGRGQDSMHQGKKNLILRRAQEKLGGGGKSSGSDSAKAVSQTGADDAAATGTSGASKDTGWGKKPDRMPRDLRELKDAVDQDELAKLVRKDPNPAQKAGYRAEAKSKGEAPIDTTRDIPRTRAEWKAKDAALGIKEKVARIKNLGEMYGIVRNEQARDLASKFPEFERLDRTIREAWKDSGIYADDVVNPEPGEQFLYLMEKRGIRWQDFRNWHNALENGHWEPVREVMPQTGQVNPAFEGGTVIAPPPGTSAGSADVAPAGPVPPQPPQAPIPPGGQPNPDLNVPRMTPATPQYTKPFWQERPFEFARRAATWDADKSGTPEK